MRTPPAGESQRSEDEFVPISALQHIVFCERQFALIHVERVWTENVLTVEGQQLHEQVDGGAAECRGDIRITRGIPLRSLRLGLIGRADVVEFHRDPDGFLRPGWSERWKPYPVEYKRGRPKLNRADEVQLCAQAICLEEMLGVGITTGALFYGKVRRRTEVTLDPQLRALVERAAARAHELMDRCETPQAKREPKCTSCSLLDICRPDAGSRSARQFLDSALRVSLRGLDE